MSKRELAEKQTNFILYTSNDGNIKVEVIVKDETIWLTQKAISELFDVQRPAITKHLKNIFDSSELAEDSVSSILEHTARDGKNYQTKFYNLDVIIAVGYRVNSYRATQFRQWAISILQQYIHKGFAIDSDRFKYGSRFSTRYFDDLLEEIRDIRSSERMAYQKITDRGFSNRATRKTGLPVRLRTRYCARQRNARKNKL